MSLFRRHGPGISVSTCLIQVFEEVTCERPNKELDTCQHESECWSHASQVENFKIYALRVWAQLSKNCLGVLNTNKYCTILIHTALSISTVFTIMMNTNQKYTIH